jgi:aminoglycoside phosphotransferase (APT) family kinase protein
MVPISASLVRELITTQFPEWAHLPIEPVVPGGWDNRTFHLGEDLSVRLPSGEAYAAQVEKEHRWLPQLAPSLPLPVPVPLAMGNPASGYPWHWSVYRWIEGENAAWERIADPCALAIHLAQFLIALQRIDATGGPPPGRHNFYRGGPLAVYDTQARQAIATLGPVIDCDTATAAWEAALKATWHGPPVWVHGDVAPGNLLLTEGRLSAVIDFGCTAVGDPASDLTIAWTLFSGESREAFRSALPLDGSTWCRGRGWALWKALITLEEHIHTNPVEAAKARRVIDAVLEEHRSADHL